MHIYNLMKYPSLRADIDECELDMDNCHMNATCADVIGSFECECNSGFEGNGVNCTSKKFLCILAMGGNVLNIYTLLFSLMYGLTIAEYL